MKPLKGIQSHFKCFFAFLIIISLFLFYICFLFQSTKRVWKNKWSITAVEPDSDAPSNRHGVRHWLYDHVANTNVSSLLRLYHQRMESDSSCQDVVKDPVSFWRSRNTTASFSAEDDYQRMCKAVRCGGILIPEYLMTPVKRNVYPYEKDFFTDEPCEDALTASNETFSTVKLLNESKEFRVGDHIGIEITLKDGRANPRKKGGDVIRVWLKDVNVKNTGVTAKVMDLRNGTYLATTLLPWAGTVSIVAALAYPREYMRALTYVHHSVKFMGGLAGKFENTQASESTPCFGESVVPGYSPTELCNLTLVNGSPWYCGRPLKKELSCSDFKATRALGLTRYLPVTDAEIFLLNRTSQEPRIRRIPVNFFISVKQAVSGQTKLSPTPVPCHKIDPKLTWHQEEPTGYLMGTEWISFLCTPAPMSKACLHNTSIVILGDSNGRNHYYRYTALTKCHHLKMALHEKWHAPLSCVDDGMKFSITWDPHSQPFIATAIKFTNKDDLVSSMLVMDNIPTDNRRRWIILNHFFHLTTCHTRVIEQKMVSLKRGVERLLERNPNTHVILQGPHVAWEGWPVHYAAGDSLGQFIKDIQKETFKDLQDRVYYANAWDITIATENADFHPPKGELFTKMVNGFLCES